MTAPAPAITLQCVPLFLRAVREAGADPAALLARFGLPVALVDAPSARIPLDLLAALAEACALAAGDDALGLTVARGQPRGTWGLLEYAGRAAPNLLCALELVVEHAPLLNDRAELELLRSAGEVRLVHRLVGAPRGVGRHFTEYTLASFALLARDVTAGAATPTRVFLTHAERKPRGASFAEIFAGAEVVHEAADNALCWSEAAVLSPLPGADPGLHALLLAQAAREAQVRPTVGGTSLPRIREVLRQGLEQGRLELALVAGRVGMSPRTLQRRLGEAGTSWQTLLDEARQERAAAWVEGSDRPLAEIADALGYAELRSFIRAYRRWTGQTPGDVRSRRAAAEVARGVHASGVR